MSEQLKARMESLRHEIAHAEGAERADLVDNLEQVVAMLYGHGRKDAPAWARDLLDQAHDAEVEDEFDNIPV